MTNGPYPPTGNALADAARANDIVIIADPDHADPNISTAIRSQLTALHDAGVTTLYIEHDPKDVTLDQLRGDSTSYSAMLRKAEALGMRIVEYDDRSAQRALASQYPEAARFALENDPYFTNRNALIAQAPDQEQMRAYVDAAMAQRDNLGPRNASITNNIATDMGNNPGGKAVVMIGEDHVNTRNDVDEGLRSRGYRTTTVEVNSTDTSFNASHVLATDKPDIVVSAGTGNAISFNDPAAHKMRAAMAGIELPWRNTEPVRDVSAGTNVSPVSGMPVTAITPDVPQR